MPSVQRRRGVTVEIWGSRLETNNRGDQVVAPDPTLLITTRGHLSPNRSSRAEVAGQQQIDMYNLLTYPDLPNVDLWSRVKIAGAWYDIYQPPEEHPGNGPNGTRHWSLVLRRRPIKANDPDG